MEEKKIDVQNIPLSKIQIKPEDNREINKKKLEQLQDSIETQSLFNPITVERIQDNDQYEYLLLAGERRFTACKNLGWTTIPAHIIEYGTYINDKDTELNDTEADTNEKKRQYVRLAENLSRQDMSEEEKAKAVYALYAGGTSYRKLAAKLGISKSYVEKLCKMALDKTAEPVDKVVVDYDAVKNSVKNLETLLVSEVTKENIEQLQSEIDTVNVFLKQKKLEIIKAEREERKQAKIQAKMDKQKLTQ